MHALDNFTHQGAFGAGARKPVMKQATRDNLDAVAWGLLYPDLWRAAGLPWLPRRYEDRGWALEADWRRSLTDPHATLMSWRADMLDGRIPIAVFNAVYVEDGRRYLLCPFTLNDGEAYASDEFVRRFPAKDLEVATAARLSATFPYVTPISRADTQRPTRHVTDGGFVDNFGVFTARNWLKNHVVGRARKLKLKRVVLLEIQAFPEPDPPNAAEVGWVMQTVGPLLAMLNLRRSSQLARNKATLEELAGLFADEHVAFSNFLIRFPQHLNERRFSGRRGRYTPPLSWRLSRAQRRAIDRGWREVLTEKDGSGAMRELRAIFPGSGE